MIREAQFARPRKRFAKWGRHLLALAFLHCLLGISSRSLASAQSTGPGEYQVKAVYLYNFGKFIQWPGDANQDNSGTFAICIVGRDPFGEILDNTLSGETVEGRKLAVRRIALHAYGDCRILFIADSEAGRIKEIIAELRDRPVVTVSDASGFTRSGGMIQFVLKDGKVRFEVNLTAAQKVKLSFSSQLLKVATQIHGAPDGGRP